MNKELVNLKTEINNLKILLNEEKVKRIENDTNLQIQLYQQKSNFNQLKINKEKNISVNSLESTVNSTKNITTKNITLEQIEAKLIELDYRMYLAEFDLKSIKKVNKINLKGLMINNRLIDDNGAREIQNSTIIFVNYNKLNDSVYYYKTFKNNYIDESKLKIESDILKHRYYFGYQANNKGFGIKFIHNINETNILIWLGGIISLKTGKFIYTALQFFHEEDHLIDNEYIKNIIGKIDDETDIEKEIVKRLVKQFENYIPDIEDHQKDIPINSNGFDSSIFYDNIIRDLTEEEKEFEKFIIDNRNNIKEIEVAEKVNEVNYSEYSSNSFIKHNNLKGAYKWYSESIFLNDEGNNKNTLIKYLKWYQPQGNDLFLSLKKIWYCVSDSGEDSRIFKIEYYAVDPVRKTKYKKYHFFFYNESLKFWFTDKERNSEYILFSDDMSFDVNKKYHLFYDSE
tara:strand:- start:161 stop:1528 length:1368 start_codon:yes stop_codon:yes gene_type:complete